MATTRSAWIVVMAVGCGSSAKRVEPGRTAGCEQRLEAATRGFLATLGPEPTTSPVWRRELGVTTVAFVTGDGRILYEAGISDQPTFGFDSPRGGQDPAWVDLPTSRPDDVNRDWRSNRREAWLASNAVAAASAQAFFRTFSKPLERCLQEPIAPQERSFQLTAKVISIEPWDQDAHHQQALVVDPDPKFVVTIRAMAVDPATAQVGLYRKHWIAVGNPEALFGAPADAVVGKPWRFEVRVAFRAGQTVWRIVRVSS